MESLVPHFIRRKYRENLVADGESHGNMAVVALFIDITGFTVLTEQLMKQGKAGIEKLAELIQKIFHPLTVLINDHRGFVSGFSGDGFTALFPIEEEEIKTIHHAYTAACKIQSLIHTLLQFSPRNQQIKIKIGVACGDVHWGFIEPSFSSIHALYYFSGQAIVRCVEAELLARPGQVVYHKSLEPFFPAEKREMINQNGFLLKSFCFPLLTSESFHVNHNRKDKNIASVFIPDGLTSVAKMGEFRKVVTVFISIDAIHNHSQLTQFMEIFFPCQKKFHPYVNHIDFGDKGCTILLFWGAPLSTEKDLENAGYFLLELYHAAHKRQIKLRTGVTYQNLYFGPVGSELRSTYTCYGRGVNQAARQMMKAKWNQILVEKEVHIHLRSKFNLRYRGNYSFKGFHHRRAMYDLISVKTQDNEAIFKTPLVGRTKELQILQNQLQLLFQGQNAGIVVIYGEPGIGKSRLLYEFYKKNTETIHWLHFTGKQNGSEPFYIFKKYFLHFFGQSDQETNNQEKIIKILEKFKKEILSINSEYAREIADDLAKNSIVFRAICNISSEYWQSLDAKARFDVSLTAMKTFFKAQSLLSPLVIEVDDSQWLDSQSIALLQYLARNIKSFPILMITTCRYLDDGSRSNIFSNMKLNQFIEIDLDPFKEKEVACFCNRYLHKKIDQRNSYLLYQKTQGNPFFLQEFLDFFSRSKWFDSDIPIDNKIKELPNSIQAVLLSRIDRLNFEVKEIVKKAAIIGVEFEVDLLSEISNSEIIPYIQQAEKQQIWQPSEDLFYIFKNTLLQKAVYEMQIHAHLKKFHQSIAEALQKKYKNNLQQKNALIAYHYERAEDYQTASKFYLDAAEYAARNYQNQEAIFLYQKCLQVPLWTDLEIINIKNHLSEVYILIGEWQQAQTILQENLETENRDSLPILLTQKILGNLYKNIGLENQAIELLTRAYQLACQKKEKYYECALLGDLASAYRHLSNFQLSRQLSQQQYKLAVQINDEAGKAIAFGNLGILYKNIGENRRALYFSKKQLAIAIAREDKRMIGIALGSIGILYKNQKDYKQALIYYKKQKQIAEELSDKQGIAIAEGNIGTIERENGNFENALQCFLHTKKMSEELHDIKGMAIAANNLGHTYQKMYDLQNAEYFFCQQWQLAQTGNDHFGLSIACANMAGLYEQKKDYQNAYKYYARQLEISQKLNNKKGIIFATENQQRIEKLIPVLKK